MFLWGSLLIVPEFATFSSSWAVTRPMWPATSVLTRLTSLLLLYSCSTIHPSPKIVLMLCPSSPNDSPRTVVEVFITLPIDWRIVGGGWFGHLGVLSPLVIWWAICCFQEVKDYHITTGFSSCPRGNKHMQACKVITNKVIPLAQASCSWALLISYHQKIDIPLLLQYFAQLCEGKSDSLLCSLSHMLKPTFVCLFINILKPST